MDKECSVTGLIQSFFHNLIISATKTGSRNTSYFCTRHYMMYASDNAGMDYSKTSPSASSQESLYIQVVWPGVILMAASSFHLDLPENIHGSFQIQYTTSSFYSSNRFRNPTKLLYAYLFLKLMHAVTFFI